jgi:hypothetical protein
MTAWDDAYHDHERDSIGGNKPPADEILRAHDLVASTNRALQQHAVVTSEEIAGLMQEQVTLLRGARTALEAKEASEQAPHKKAIEDIRARYTDPLELVDIALEKLLGRLTPYMVAKRERLQCEANQREADAEAARERAERARDRAVTNPSIEADLEARRLAEEAAELSDAAGKPAGRARVKGDLAPRAMHLHTYWHAEVDDMPLAFGHYGKQPKVWQAIDLAVRRAANKHAVEAKDEAAAPPGVRFVKREVAQ